MLPEPAESPRAEAIIRVLVITLILNWLIAGAKIFLGLSFKNLTVLSDGFHSLLDGTNNVLGIIAIKLAARPADELHPYGHRKFEHVAAMLIGGVVMLLCWETMRNVVLRVRSGILYASDAVDYPPVDMMAVAILIGAALINAGVAICERRAGYRLNSNLLKADSMHTFSDCFVTSLGLLSLVFSRHFWWLDPLLATGVVCFLLYAAWMILMENIATMTDRSRLDPHQIATVAEDVDGVRNAHAIRSHGMENDIHVDLHIVVDSTLRAGEVSQIEEHVKIELKKKFPEITLVSVHHECEEPETKGPLWRDE